MFYQAEMDEALRLGDVVKGYIFATPNIKQPVIDNQINGFNIEINHPPLSVVVSPCCSVEQKAVLLTPLIHVFGNFYTNPFFAEDLTRINRTMTPQQAMAPMVWERLPDEEKLKRIQVGVTYALVDHFIYSAHLSLPTYTINRRDGNISTNYYMIDFRNITRVSSEKVLSQCGSKCIQLSIQTRSELRDKIANFYQRKPDEDKFEDD